MKTTLLRDAIRRGLRTYGWAGASLAMACTTESALAQNAAQDSAADSQKLETITVTGSNIRRVDIETANPVITIDRAAIQKTGKLNVGDLIQDLPSISGNAMSPKVNNGGSGGAAVSLRGLGSGRTLILVNGHRLISPGGSADVSILPTNMIERIEVLGDGASATYGSDAIGGVVNFILRSDYQGAEFSVDYGISDHDDGERKGYNVTFGQSTDKGSIIAGAKYEKFDAVPAGNRKYSAFAYYLRSGVGTTPGGSARTPRSQVTLPGSVAAELGITGCSASANGSIRVSLDPSVTGTPKPSDYHCYSGSSRTGDAFNFQSIGNFDATEQERTSLFVIGNYKLTDNITAYMEAFHNKSSATVAGAPLPFDAISDNVFISKDNYYNPFGIDFGADSGNEFLTRWLAAGPRLQAIQNTTDQINTGFKGTFGDSSWQWDLNYNYGHFSFFRQKFGYVYYGGMADALGPSFYNTDANAGPVGVVCGSPGNIIAGCTPVNIFNQNDPGTKSALSPFLANPFDAVTYISREWSASANGELFELPAGAVNLAVGGSYRKEYQRTAVDFITIVTNNNGTCVISQEACRSPLSGDFTVKEAYAELLIPVLKDIPFVHSLNVSLGDRYSKYSSVGNTNNWKVAVEWRPIEDLLLRGTVSKVFRAPTLNNIYGGRTGSAPSFTDPCTAEGPGPSTNPACHGVVSGNVPGSELGQATAVNSGSQLAGVKLKPEFGKSFDFGFVYDPHWLEGLTVGADLWRIYLNDTITGISAQTSATLCYKSSPTNPSPYCSLLHRDDTGRLLFVSQPIVNLGRLDTRGVDFNASYRLPETAFGKFRLGFQSTYTAQYKNWANYGVDADPLFVNVAGHYNKQFGNFARWRALANLDWSLGSLDAGLQARYISGVTVGYADGTGPSVDQFVPNVQQHYGSLTYLNFHAGYNIEPINTRVEVGVDNLTDRQPPRFYQNNVINANTDVNTYDTVGRYYFARLTVKF